MATKGDAIECRCGAMLALENDRVPWHKKPGTSLNCPTSGTPAENWVPVPGKVVSVGGLVLACPECASKHHIRNAPKDSSYPLACGACGAFGTLEEFVSEALKAKPVQRKHRYGG